MDHTHHHHHDTTAEDVPTEYQATCPVTGDTVDMREAEKLGHTREYKDKKYYFCCATCTQLFDEDPKQYVGHKEQSKVLTLVEKEHLVGNVWAFRFKAGEPLAWVPGQYIRVELPHRDADEEGTKRWFTVSSAPYEEVIQITTRVTDSTFKQALANLPIGSELHLLEAPHGSFVWEDGDKPIVFVAGGIGITPFRSILKQRMHEQKPLNATLIYGGRNEDLPFKDELEQWSNERSELNIHYVIGSPLDAQKVANIVPNVNSSLVYISGPEPMVEGLSSQLKEAGLPESQLREDFFPNYNETNY